MDTPKLLLGRKNRKSLGTLRLSGSPKTPHGDVINEMCSTPPSSKSASSPNTTPKMRKSSFVGVESPSQSYDYSSPSRLSQEFDCNDVGWEWGDKTSHSKSSSAAQKAAEEKTRRQRSKMKRLQKKQVREDSKRSDQNKGFHKFKMEVEQLFQRSLTEDEHSTREGSRSNPAKEDRTKDLNESSHCLSSKNDQQKANQSLVKSPTAKENQSHSCNFLDNSEIDALLLEASQSVEEHIVKTGVTENSTKETPPKSSEMTEKIKTTLDGSKRNPQKASEIIDITEISSDEDSVDEMLLSICDDELIQLTNSGVSSTTQKGKTSFSRYNSMPPQPQERMSASSAAKSFIRHSSMPPDNQNSSGLGTGTGTETIKSDNQKRICTKEEVEKKKLEAKKRQLLSQQRRLLLNSKNKALVLR